MCWWCTAYPSTARPCVCSGMTEPNYGLYPSREMQMEWLKVYLQAYKLFTKNTEEVSQRELETLYVQVNKFALVRQMHTVSLASSTLLFHGTHLISHLFSLKASHFFWGFWALIQAKYSSIDFDFLG